MSCYIILGQVMSGCVGLIHVISRYMVLGQGSSG